MVCWLDLDIPPFIGVPLTSTPPAMYRNCMASQLGIDEWLIGPGAIGEQLPYPPGLTAAEIAIAKRFCESIGDDGG
jgi:hypothetical protein